MIIQENYSEIKRFTKKFKPTEEIKEQYKE